MSPYVPLSKRGDPKFTETLHPGVPPWLAPTLLEFVKNHMFAVPSFEQEFRDGMMRTIERTLHVSLAPNGRWHTMRDRLVENAELVLDVVDFLVAHVASEEDEIEEVSAYFEEAGSEWHVVRVNQDESPYGRLEKRVPDEVSTRFERSSSGASRAGEHLKGAWSALYGRSPNPNDASWEAVSAVEAAAIPIVCPADTKATLSSIVGQMKNTPAKFVVNLRPKDSVDAFDQLVGMMQLLWKSQADRHGTPEERTHTNISATEAEAGVHLAITLVHWFRSGVVTRIP